MQWFTMTKKQLMAYGCIRLNWLLRSGTGRQWIRKVGRETKLTLVKILGPALCGVPLHHFKLMALHNKICSYPCFQSYVSFLYGGISIQISSFHETIDDDSL